MDVIYSDFGVKNFSQDGDYLYFYFFCIGNIERDISVKITNNIGPIPFSIDNLFLSSDAKSTDLQYSLDKLINIEWKTIMKQGISPCRNLYKEW